MEKQNIITKIISEAEAKAVEQLAAAERRAEQIKADAVSACEAEREAALLAVKAKGEAIASGREITARLDCNKALLSAKREVLDSVFGRAQEKLCELGEGDYVALIGTLLEKYAEEGDSVILSARCGYSASIAALPVFSARSLKMQSPSHGFSGGCVLVGSGCDKNLTFEAIVQSVKEEKQAEIAARLFG